MSSAEPRPRRPQSTRALILLGAGAALGIGFALLGLFRAGGARDAALGPGAAARVNGVPILDATYQRALAALASDRRSPLEARDRSHVLDRLVDEELLVQRGVELGLLEVDRRVRKELVAAVIAAVVAETRDAEPTDAELRDFYEREGEFFVRTGRLRVRQLFFGVAEDDAEAEARAAAAADRLAAGETFQAVSASADPPVLVVPDALVPAAKLRDYLGPTALRAVLELEVGQVSRPVRSGTGIHVLQLLDREPASTPAFESIGMQLRAEYRRRAGDRALRDYLDRLREEGQVVVREAGE